MLFPVSYVLCVLSVDMLVCEGPVSPDLLVGCVGIGWEASPILGLFICVML